MPQELTSCMSVHIQPSESNMPCSLPPELLDRKMNALKHVCYLIKEVLTEEHIKCDLRNHQSKGR